MQDVRDATAQYFLDLQITELDRNSKCSLMLIEFAFDETETPTRLTVANEEVPMMVVHSLITRKERDGATNNIHIVLPTAVLENTTASCLWAALWARSPWTMEQLRNMADEVIFIFNTDSAKSCLKVGRHMGELVPTLHAPCRMHQLCLVLVAVMKRSGLMSALFCACNLLRKKRVQTRIRNNLLILVEARLIVDFDEGPTEEAKTEVKAALSFLEQAIASASLAEGEDAQSRSKRLSALQRLRCFLGGRINAIELRHHCPLGCHPSREACVKSCHADICEVFVSHPPPNPVWNKWTKIWPPVAWFASFILLNLLLPGAFDNILDQLHDDDYPIELAEAFLLNPDEKEAFKYREAVRFRRT